ncbi:MAG: hypothetical protein K6D59_09165 [Bacteroidales bacterium]|nr:hypothetical protein [Bacteroidales bacterium]
MIAAAQSKKVETFDKNSWRWIESADKYHTVAIEDGYLLVSNLQKNKKYTDYQNLAKTFARLPLRPNDSFKLTIKYLVPNYNDAEYSILFNTAKKCIMDEEEEGQFETYGISMEGPKWELKLGKFGEKSDKLPGTVKVKDDYPMVLVIEKKSRIVSIELNGIELFEDELEIKNPCVGFLVPLWDKKKSYLKVDEVIVEQAEEEE